MIIQSHEIELSSSHSSIDHHEKNERLEAWTGDNRLQISSQNGKTEMTARNWGRANPQPSAILDISQPAMAKFLESADLELPQKTSKTPLDKSSAFPDDDEANLPTKLQLTKMILERFFGIKVEIVKPGKEEEPQQAGQNQNQSGSKQAPQQPQPQGWGIHYTYHEVNYQKETVTFSAAGEITTEDGRKINFDAQLEMSKETLEEVNIELRAGDAAIDPLALNFDGKGVQLTGEKYEFDLDMDGEVENISFLEQGSGFLVLDKNQNGIVDDGGELFGPETDHGFLELKAYDEDQNNWIDENDAIYYQLNIWTKNEEGADLLSSLQEYDIGALYLDSTRTPFDLEEGQLRETGIYLKENGDVNVIQEVDLKASSLCDLCG